MGSRSPVKQVKRGGKPRLVIDFFYLDEHGKRQRFRRDAHVQTMTAARAEAQRLMDLAARTGSPFGSTVKVMPTFASFVDTTYRPVFMPRLRPGTRTRYEGIFRQGLLDEFGPVRLDEIRFAPVLRYANELSERPRARPYRGKRKGIDPRGHVNLLRSVLQAAVDAGELPEVPKLPTFKLPEKLPEAPDRRHVGVLLERAPGWLLIAVSLQSLAGLRQGEVRALQVGDLDFENGEILVRRTFSGEELFPPKSNAERAVPMLPLLAELLRGAIRGKQPSDFVLLDDKGQLPTRQRYLASLKAFQKKAGLRSWGSHALRHFFCSELARNGVSSEAIRKLMGHSGLKVTELYLHATQRDLHDAVGKLTGRTGKIVATS